MSSEIHDKILAFISGEFVRKDFRQCLRLELRHMQTNYNGPADVLRSWERSEDPALFEDLTRIELLTSEIVKLAEEEANVYPGVQRFTLRTEQFKGGRVTCSFLVAPEFNGNSDATLALASDTSASGSAVSVLQNVIAMEMRHNERNSQINAQMFKGTIDVLGNANTELVTENQKLREERAQMLKELEESRSAQGERDLRGMAQIAADARKDKAVGKLLTLAPIAVAKILGKDGMPGAPTPLSILVSELGKSLTPAQIAKIAQSLSMEQQMLFAEAMKTAQTSAETEEKKPADAPAGDKTA